MKLNEKTKATLLLTSLEAVNSLRQEWKEAQTDEIKAKITDVANELKSIAAAIANGTIQILANGERTETETSLRAKVKEMRDAQREYFKTRSRSALDRSRSLERAVDDILAADNTQQLPKQQTLF